MAHERDSFNDARPMGVSDYWRIHHPHWDSPRLGFMVLGTSAKPHATWGSYLGVAPIVDCLDLPPDRVAGFRLRADGVPVTTGEPKFEHSFFGIMECNSPNLIFREIRNCPPPDISRRS